MTAGPSCVTIPLDIEFLKISYRDRCPTGLNREVRCNAGAVPPLYWGANPSNATGTKVLGRFGRAKIQSQENCLSDNHRLIHEGWGGDSDTAPVLNFFPAFILPGFLLKKTRELRQFRQPSTPGGCFFMGSPNCAPYWLRRGFISRRLFCRGASIKKPAVRRGRCSDPLERLRIYG